MNAFDDARLVEAEAMAVLLPFAKRHAKDGQVVTTDKGALSLELQAMAGDVLLNVPDGAVVGVEVKIERTSRHGNFFLEIWSNVCPERPKPGWLATLWSDLIWYYFIDTDDLYVMRRAELFRWAFEQRNIYRYPEKEQRQRQQLNRTRGACVPIADVASAISVKVFHPRGALAEAA